MPGHLWQLSAVELASAIRAQAVSSEDVICAHLERIEQVNGRLNAITVVFADEALARARVADAVLRKGHETGPLHGVPITVKENIDVAGSATTCGVVDFEDAIAERDAPVIRHLKAAGAIVIGRTNMPDFGIGWHTENDLHGATLNPWRTTHTPGGSSGGEAAAIAAGLSPLGVGNDMGGSTRQPASCCGIAGLRPTTGRVSRIRTTDPPMFYEQVACVNGPMARCVADLRLALQVMSAPDWTDPMWTPALTPPDAPRAVGVVTDPSGDGTAPNVLRAIEKATSALEEAGYVVEAVEPPLLEEADETIQCLAEAEARDALESTLEMVSKYAGTILRNAIGPDAPDTARYRNAIAQRYRIAAAWNGLMERYPLVLGPVSTLETFPVGFDTGGRDSLRRLVRSFRLTEICNLVGLPSVAVPTGVAEGLPQGVQIIGRRFDESRCFDAAELIESRCGTLTPIDVRAE